MNAPFHALTIVLFWLACALSGLCATSTNLDLSGFFGGRNGCFVLYDAQADSCLRYNPKGCAERFTPCSTFKIANSLIALHTGVATGPEFFLKWDGVMRPIARWNQDHTLRSAMSNSVVWFYQEIARRIGLERMDVRPEIERQLGTLRIPLAAVAIEEFEGHCVLVVERFDRRWTGDNRLLRLPQEDCCQALSVPPSLKYESEGGPGIPAILNLLKGSDQPEADQTTFLKAVIAFWLLGATDGHAKNFSVFLSPGGRFRMTPLYDVISAQPSLDAGQIQRNKMKLAMAVGDSRHYVVDSVMPRHFVQTAAKAGIGAGLVTSIFDELLTQAPTAVEQVTVSLPRAFPAEVADSISNGFKTRLRRLEGHDTKDRYATN